MRIYTGLIFLLVACGSPEPGGDGEETKLTTQGEPSPANPAAENSPKAEYAQLVADVAALPACDAATEGRLYYAKAEAQFQVCAAAAWSVIDLKGVAGIKGDKGDKGDKGEAGEDGVAAAANTWLDSITGKTWLIGGGTSNYNTAKNACGNGWAHPKTDEMAAAATHGMFAGFSGKTLSQHQCAWSQDSLNGDPARSVISPGVTDCNSRTELGIYCVGVAI